MKNKMIKWICAAVILGFCFEMLHGFLVSADQMEKGSAAGKEVKACKVGTALKVTAESLGLAQNGMNRSACRKVLLEEGLVKKGEWKEYDRVMTREEMAVLCSRVLAREGEADDEEVIRRVARLHRISDLNQAKEENRDSVVRIFAKGIMIGNSKGEYTQDRSFDPQGGISKTGVGNVIRRCLHPEERHPMSPDGQLLRRKKLPFNSEEYEYILARFPNSFYQFRYAYETATYDHLPISPKDYAAPVNLKNRERGDWIGTWKYDWAEIIAEHYRRKLNFDYRTDGEEWIEALAETYCSRVDEDANRKQKEAIRTWVKQAKQNHVILECDLVSTEPSTCYYGPTLNVLTFVRFRVLSCDQYEKNRDRAVFGRVVDLSRVKRGEWYSGVLSNTISWYTLSPTEDTAGCTTADGFCPGLLEQAAVFRKEEVLIPTKIKEHSYCFEEKTLSDEPMAAKHNTEQNTNERSEAGR